MNWRLLVVTLLGLGSLLEGCGGDRAVGACTSAHDCAAGELCVSGQCQALSAKRKMSCAADEECGSNQYCDFGVCKDKDPVPTPTPTPTPTMSPSPTPSGCNADPDCGGGGQVCENKACVPGCASIGSVIQCSGGDSCNATSGRCEAPMNRCSSDPECRSPTAICENGQCVAGCADPGGTACSGGNICGAAGRCEPPPPCASDTTCGAPSNICEAGRCTPGCGRPGGLSCGAGDVCNSNTGRCQPLAGPCSNDAACGAPAQVCETGQCVPGCSQAGGIQCSGSSVCNNTTGRCDMVPPPPCSTDAACAPPATICIASACAPSCLTTGCSPTEQCNNSTGHCEAIPTCAADAFEQNDTPAAASTNVTARAAIPGLTACEPDSDFYAFTLAAGDRIRVDVLFRDAEGDIDIQLIKPSGAVAVTSEGTVDNESLSFTADEVGRYLIEVALYADSGAQPGNTYSLEITHTPAPPPPMCTADALEENDSLAAAQTMAMGHQANLTLCTGDDDYYSVSLLPGDQLTARLSFTAADGDVDLRLLDAAGTSVASSLGTGSTESLTYTAMTAATYAVRAYLYSDPGMPGVGYTIDLSRAVICPLDRYEHNDDQAGQRSLAAGNYTGVFACNTDDDFYSFRLTAGQALTVTARFAHAEGDIDIYLGDSTGAVLTGSADTTDDESFTFTPSATGTYTLLVTLYQDLGTRPGNSYSLDLRY